ncbi:hypothetical protein CF326_g8667 [Tilletia indica]|nr:hypothetical protein CF326_g8667 [Tilletia indica]
MTTVNSFFQAPELLLQVLGLLTTNLIDIPTLSTVSKRFRQIVLPYLVRRSLRVESRLGPQQGDVAPDPPSPTTIESFQRLCWTDCQRFLGLFADINSSSAPLIDISSGLSNLPQLRSTLAQAPSHLIERTTALRIIVDLTKPEQPDPEQSEDADFQLDVNLDEAVPDPEQPNSEQSEDEGLQLDESSDAAFTLASDIGAEEGQFPVEALRFVSGGAEQGQHIETPPIQRYFDDLATIVDLVCDQQEANGTDYLKTFHFEPGKPEGSSGFQTYNCMDGRIFERLAPRIQDLALCCSVVNFRSDAPYGAFDVLWKLLIPTWTALRRIRFRMYHDDVNWDLGHERCKPRTRYIHHGSKATP